MRHTPRAVFGKPDMSGDNAVGVALIGLAALRQEKVQASSGFND
jgi:hypothetical protein